MILKEFIPKKKDIKEQFNKDKMEFNIKIKTPLFVSFSGDEAIACLIQKDDEIFYKDIKIEVKLIISNHKNITSKNQIKIELQATQTLADIGKTSYKYKRKQILFKNLELDFSVLVDYIKTELEELKVLSQIYKISDEVSQVLMQDKLKRELKNKFNALLDKDFELVDIEKDPFYREIYLTFLYTQNIQRTAKIFNLDVDEVNLIINKIEHISINSFCDTGEVHLDIQTAELVNKELGTNLVNEIQNKFQKWKGQIIKNRNACIK